MLRKYVTGMVPLVRLLKYVTDIQKITSGEIGKNAKYVIKSLSLIDWYVENVWDLSEKNIWN